VPLLRSLRRSSAGPCPFTACEQAVAPSVSTTMIYTHVLNKGGGAVRNPADALALFPAGYSVDTPGARIVVTFCHGVA